MTTVRLIIFILTADFIYGQTSSVNGLDAKGKKNGYWLQYLDLRLNPTDSSNSYYKGFEFYDHGNLIYKFNEHKWYKRDTLLRPNPLPTKGQPQLISGRFTWTIPQQDSILTLIRDFKDGYPVYEKVIHPFFKNLSWPSFTEELDFTKRYNNIPGTHYAYETHFENPSKDTKTWIRKESWFYKKGSKWKYHRLKN